MNICQTFVQRQIAVRVVCFTLLASVTAQSEVHFAFPKDSDHIIHPKNLVKHSIFQIKKAQSTDKAGNQTDDIYIVESCKTPPLEEWKTCGTYGPIPRAKMEAYLEQSKEAREAISEDLAAAESFYNETENTDKAPLQLAAMVPGMGALTMIPFAVQMRRLGRLTEKVSPIDLIYESETRENKTAIFAKGNLDRSYENFKARLKSEVAAFLDQ